MAVNLTEVKSSGIAVVLSFFIPGLGQIYNGQIGKGILIIILSIIFFSLSYILIGIPFYVVLWIYSMYNAYKVAEATHIKESTAKPDEALGILDKRYASGEISKIQYKEMKKDLK